MKKKQTINHSVDLQQPTQVNSTGKMLDTAFNLHQRGNLAQAEQLYRQILQSQPAHDYVLNLLGVLLAQRGDHYAGEQLIARAIGINPEVADYHNNLGLIQQQQGKMNEAAASFKKSIKFNPQLTDAWLGLGNVSMYLEGPDTAINAYRKVISINPDFLPAYNNLGNVYCKTRQYAKARETFNKAIELNPGSAEVWYNIGVMYMAEKKGEQAIPAFDKAIALNPGYLKAYSKRGYCRHEYLNDTEGANQDFDHVINKDPFCIPAYLSKANIYLKKEDFDTTEQILRGVLQLNEPSVNADKPDRVKTSRIQPDDHSPYPDPVNLGYVHFMLGDLHDKQGNYQMALNYYNKANSIHGNLVTYDRSAHEKMTDQLISFFSADFFSEFSSAGTDQELPVIITGLSRSGKTLTEYGMTRHSDIMAGGEICYFTRIGQAPDFFFKTDELWPYCCRSLSDECRKFIIDQYLEILRGFSDTARFVTDTTPRNNMFLGLIRLLFPNIPIIHCRRDPLDHCLSIYFKNYRNINSFSHSYDLENIGHYYLQYKRLMSHWDKVLPGPPVIECRYEDLVNNFETHSHRLMNLCGLEFDASTDSGTFRKQNAVAGEQREEQKIINNTNVQFSKHYEKFIEPLQELFAKAALAE